MTPRQTAVLLFVCLASTASAQSRVNQKVPAAAAAAPASRPAPSTFAGLERGTSSFSTELERAVFNPRGLRAPLSQRLSSLDRELEPGEEVVILEPARFVVKPESADPGHGIEYLWEVLISDQGVLVAVPVPVLASFTRASKPCEGCSPSLPKGKCTTAGFCFGELPLDENCMKKLDSVPDVDLLKGLCGPQKKSAAGLQADVDFAVSYAVRSWGEAGWIAIWGTASARPASNIVWAGALIEGVGYFLDDTHDGAGVTGVSGAAAAAVAAVIGEQGLATPFEFGIKEKGIR